MKRTMLVVLLAILLGSSPLSAQLTVSLGTHTGSGSTNVLLSTSTTSNRYSRTMSIYTASEIIAAGGMAGLITSLAWDKGGTGEYLSNDAYIKVFLKHHTGGSAWSTSPVPEWDVEVVGATEVFTSSTYSLPQGIGWAAVPFTTPFIWNGTDDIVVMVEWDRASTPTGAITWGRSTTTNANATRVGSASLSALVMLVNSNRPLLQLTFLPGATDAGLEGFVNLSDSICEGIKPITVTLKNHGPNPMSMVDIEWEVNNVPQPTYNWSGSLAANATTDVTIGSYPFVQGVSYNVSANTSGPNGAVDTLNLNDTIHLAEIHVKPSPSFTLHDTIINICQGDTATISGTLSGTAPFEIMVDDGIATTTFSNITTTTFSMSVSPASSKTYTIVSVTDATSCENTSAPAVDVVVQQAPPATITPAGSTAACQGDSVSLMASVGLNFSYTWYHDGIIIPGATSHSIGAKQSGTYEVRVTSPIGCSNLSSPVGVTIHPIPVVSIGNDTALLPDATIQLDAGTGFNTYLWSTGETSQTVVIDSSGTGIGIKTVWVHVTDNVSCKGGDTILVHFTPTPGIHETYINLDLRIFPNPSSGQVEVILSDYLSGTFALELFNTNGQMVHRDVHQLQHNKQLALDLGHLLNGIYLIKMMGDGYIATGKIIIRDLWRCKSMVCPDEKPTNLSERTARLHLGDRAVLVRVYRKLIGAFFLMC